MMDRHEIYTSYDENGTPSDHGHEYEVEGLNALDAIVRAVCDPGILADMERTHGTRALALDASDDDMCAAAYAVPQGWEVHVQVDGQDIAFTIALGAHPMSVRQAADVLGVNRQRVHQLLAYTHHVHLV